MVLREVLALCPETAVPESLKIAGVMLDNLRVEEIMDVDWSESYCLIHALHLLHDLPAPEVLDVYRRLLRHDSLVTEYWFGDAVSEEVPELLARASQTRLPELLVMLKGKEIPLKHRLMASDAISRLGQRTARAAARHQCVFAVLPAPRHCAGRLGCAAFFVRFGDLRLFIR